MTKEEKITKYLNDKEYYNIVKSILDSEEFQKRKEFKHHENCSVYEHCLQVSYQTYKVCKKLHLNYHDAAIGGLLHDFYEKPWQDNIHQKDPFFKQHGFSHAKNALENTLKYYPELINDRVSNIIVRHMFPLNIHPPKYPEAWMITLVDKKVSLDILKPNKEMLKYLGLAKKEKK